ncbi:hypothetical protein MMPV_008914 [Pyropia vietnamensis]
MPPPPQLRAGQLWSRQRLPGTRSIRLLLVAAAAAAAIIAMATAAKRRLDDHTTTEWSRHWRRRPPPASVAAAVPLPADAPLRTVEDVWERSWTNASLLRSSPGGELLAATVAALDAWQNPANCSAASYLLYRYHSSTGFGAQVRHHLPALHAALRSRRVLLLDTRRPFYWALGGCPLDAADDGRWTCFFQPLSRSCPPTVVAALVARGALSAVTVQPGKDVHPALVVPIAGAPGAADVVTLDTRRSDRFHRALFVEPGGNATDLTRILLSPGEALRRAGSSLIPGGDAAANATAAATATAASLSWMDLPPAAVRRAWLVAAIHTLTRLNARTAAVIRSARSASPATAVCAVGTGVVAAGTVGAGIGASGSVGGCTVGVPLRGSDKCFRGRGGRERRRGFRLGAGEMQCVPLAAAVDAAARLAFSQPHIDRMLLTSEDPSAIAPDAVAAAVAPTAPWAPPLAIYRAAEDIPPGTGSKVIARRTEAAWRTPTLAEVGLASLTTLHLQAAAAYHVLTPRSTYHSWVAAAAKAVPAKAADVVYPLGDGKGLTLSLVSQM